MRFHITIVALLAATFGWQTAAQEVERTEHEQAFEQLLSGVELVGFFTLDDAPEGQAPSGDRYTIRKVTKQRDGVFRFDAVMHYTGRDVPLAIALPVRFAGSTPVITLDNLAIPGVGTFSARVLFDGNRYAGTWSGRTHGGHMYGDIVPLASPQGAEAGPADSDGNWPQFRGVSARGVAPDGELLTEWNVESGDGVLWKAEIPGLAHSAPVIWGNRLFVTTAVRTDADDAELTVGLYGSIQPVDDEGVHQHKLYCLDKNTGEMLWERTAIEAVPAIKRHPKGSHAASTPATDGERVVALYGSEGLYCYDMSGELLWANDLGVLDSGYYLVKDAQWGFASSPIIHDDLVIVQCDVQDDSFIAAYAVDTGEEVWRTPRNEVPTWGSPTVYTADGRTQIAVNGWKHIGGYDLQTGEETWKLAVGGGDIPVPTPIIEHDLIYITNAHGRMAPIMAIRTSASGELPDFDDEAVVWIHERGGNYMQTPIIVGDLLFMCRDNGVVTCIDATTGEEHYRERLGSGRTGFTASAVAGDGKVFFTAEEGDIYVLRAAPEFEVLAVNSMGETCMATPAISDGVIYFRTRSHIVAVGE